MLWTTRNITLRCQIPGLFIYKVNVTQKENSLSITRYSPYLTGLVRLKKNTPASSCHYI